jgi:hypothetical protein
MMLTRGCLHKFRACDDFQLGAPRLCPRLCLRPRPRPAPRGPTPPPKRAAPLASRAGRRRASPSRSAPRAHAPSLRAPRAHPKRAAAGQSGTSRRRGRWRCSASAATKAACPRLPAFGRSDGEPATAGPWASGNGQGPRPHAPQAPDKSGSGACVAKPAGARARRRAGGRMPAGGRAGKGNGPCTRAAPRRRPRQAAQQGPAAHARGQPPRPTLSSHAAIALRHSQVPAGFQPSAPLLFLLVGPSRSHPWVPTESAPPGRGGGAGRAGGASAPRRPAARAPSARGPACVPPPALVGLPASRAPLPRPCPLGVRKPRALNPAPPRPRPAAAPGTPQSPSQWPFTAAQGRARTR